MAGSRDLDRIHISVLLDETMEYLSPCSGGTYVDGTLGLGGHSLEILKRSEPDGSVIAFEWDEQAIALATTRLGQYAHRMKVVRRNFAEIADGLEDLDIKMVDGILVDIGLSSLQLDMKERGFSFMGEDPLDMRMDIGGKTTAASIVNSCSEEELADIFYYYGDEKQARPIAREIIQERKERKIVTTKQLATLVAKAIPKRFHPKKIHVATKVFQALRVAVNRELENLAALLDDGVYFLKPGARFCVISFHSLEDRLVKRKFKENKKLEVLTQKPIMATPEEKNVNPRARSARLRVAMRR